MPRFWKNSFRRSEKQAETIWNSQVNSSADYRIDDPGQWRFGGWCADEIVGTDGNDWLFGFWGNDRLIGGAGKDRVFGGSGNDEIEGNEGNDLLSGGSGDDTLIGGAGTDLLLGGRGDDTAHFQSTFDDYAISQISPVWRVEHLGGDGGDGTDFLAGVERLVFADGFEVFLDDRNTLPFGITDQASVDEAATIEKAAVDGLLANDIDFNGDTLSVGTVEGSAAHVGVEIALPSGALLTVNGDGSYSYDPNGVFDGLGEGEEATDSFVYQASDGEGLSAPITVEITITGSVALTQGAAIDGYVSGATVFADADGDGLQDQGEASAITDAGGNFVLADAEGQLILAGGIDVSTGLPFLGQLRAPAGSTVVTPLTTLIVVLMELGLSQQGAAARIADAFGLGDVGDLTGFDPIAAALSGDPGQSAEGINAQSVAVQVQNTIQQIAALLNGAGLEPGQAQNAAIDALAGALAETTGPIDLSDPSVIAAIVNAASSGGPLSEETLAGAAGVIAETNGATQTAAENPADAASALEEIAQVQIVVQTGAAPALAEAGGTDDSSAAEEAFTGQALDDAVVDAADDVGDVDGGTTGSDLPETFAGTDENDFVDGRGGADVFDLRAYSKLGYEITIGQNGAPTIIKDIDPGDGDTGTDTLVNVELAFFADARVFLDGRNSAPVLVDRISTLTPENQTGTGLRFTVVDPDGDDIGYSLSGGADKNLFDIDPSTGFVTFKAAPDFEAPGDADGDNSYEIVIRASDAFDFTEFDGSVSVANVDEAPVFTSQGFVAIAENATAPAYRPAAFDPDGQPVKLSLLGGPDASLFLFDAVTEELRFRLPPDFEAPGDANGDNIYEVTIGADDGSAVSTQNVHVRVENTPGDEPLTYFLKIEGLEGGNATDPDYPAGEGWIEVDAFAFGVNGDITVTPGETDVEIGHPGLSNLTINFGAAGFDMARLDANLVSGAPLGDAVLVGISSEAFGPNGEPPPNRELVRFEVTGPAVTGSHTTGGPDGLDQTVTLDFQRLTYQTDELTQEGQIVPGQVFASRPLEPDQRDALDTPDSPTGKSPVYVLRIDDDTWIELDSYDLSLPPTANSTGRLSLTRQPDGQSAKLAAQLEGNLTTFDLEVWQVGISDRTPIASYELGFAQILSVEQSGGIESAAIEFGTFAEAFDADGDGEADFTFETGATPGAGSAASVAGFDWPGPDETSQPPAPLTFYLKLGDGAHDASFTTTEGWIEVDAYDLGLSIPASPIGQGPPPPVGFSGLALDLADATLDLSDIYGFLLNGAVTDAALVGIATDGQGETTEFFRLGLTRAIVDAASQTAGQTGLDYRLTLQLQEDVDGSGLTWETTALDPDGNPLPPEVFDPEEITQPDAAPSLDGESGIGGDGLVYVMRLDNGAWVEIDGFSFGADAGDPARPNALIIDRASDAFSAALAADATKGLEQGLLEIEVWRVDTDGSQEVASYDFRKVLASDYIATGDGAERLVFAVNEFTQTTRSIDPTSSRTETVSWDFAGGRPLGGGQAGFDWDQSLADETFGGSLSYYLYIGDGTAGLPVNGDYDLDPDWVAIDDFSFDVGRNIAFARGDGQSAIGSKRSGGLSVNVDSDAFDFSRLDARQFNGTLSDVALVGVTDTEPDGPYVPLFKVELEGAYIAESSTKADLDGLDQVLTFFSNQISVATRSAFGSVETNSAFDDYGPTDPAVPLQVGDEPSSGDDLIYMFKYGDADWETLDSFAFGASTVVSTSSSAATTRGLTVTRASDDLSALFASHAALGADPELLDVEVWRLENEAYVPVANFTFDGTLVEDFVLNGDGTETIQFEFTRFANDFAAGEPDERPGFDWDIIQGASVGVIPNDFDWM